MYPQMGLLCPFGDSYQAEWEAGHAMLGVYQVWVLDHGLLHS
jgi:hypothetical protein